MTRSGYFTESKQIGIQTFDFDLQSSKLNLFESLSKGPHRQKEKHRTKDLTSLSIVVDNKLLIDKQTTKQGTLGLWCK